MLFKKRVYKIQRISVEQLMSYEKVKSKEICENYADFYDTNIEIRNDLALFSTCRDYAIEQLLYSKKFTFENIGVIMNPYKYAPQTAVLLMYSRKKVAVEITVIGAQDHSYQDISDFKNYHKLSITGLEKGQNKVILVMKNQKGRVIDEREVLLPLKNEKLKKQPLALKHEKQSPCIYDGFLITGSAHSLPYVFRNDGSIMHYNKLENFKTRGYGIFPLSRKRFLWPVGEVCAQTFANAHSSLVYEMDYMGRIYKTFHVKNGMHHYACELPNGNIIGCSNSNEEHTEDIVIEVDRNTGEIVSTLYMYDIFGKDYMDQVDWVHCNCVEYNQEDDSLLICLRNVHAFVKIHWSTKEVMWILSLPEFWENTKASAYVLKPKGEMNYSFQAHAAHEVTEYEGLEPGEKAYIIFDNHKLNRRPVEGYSGDGYSYINMYAVNEKEKSVRQLLNFQIPFSSIRSNAVCDQKNNRLLNFSGCRGRQYNELYGVIEEYNLQTGELLNEWKYDTDFFSGEVFEWHSDDYSEAISANEDSLIVCGELDSLNLTDTVDTPDMILDNTDLFSDAYVEGHTLYFKTTDHGIESLLFVGQNHTYEKDYTNTVQTAEVHAARRYFFTVGFQNLEPDEYRVCVKVNGEIYDTQSNIMIKKMLDEK